jgi:hypothetical protein
MTRPADYLIPSRALRGLPLTDHLPSSIPHLSMFVLVLTSPLTCCPCSPTIMAHERPRKGPAQGLPPAFVPAAAAAATPAAAPKFGHAVTIKAPTASNTGLSPQKTTSVGLKNGERPGIWRRTRADEDLDTTQRLCRNVLIYGSCRFQDKGCVYAHSIDEEENDAKAEEAKPSE